MSRYVALVGEVEDAPLGGDLEALPRRLRDTLVRLNRDLAPELPAPLVSPGQFPEIVGVLSRLDGAYTVARALAEGLHPLPVRVAATLGTVNLPLGSTDAEAADGPAFDEAADLLYRARKEDRLLLVSGISSDVDALANALLLLLYRQLQGWTERQAQVVRLYRRHHRQQAVAQVLGISQQSVSSSLAAAGWKDLMQSEAVLESVLARRGIAEL